MQFVVNNIMLIAVAAISGAMLMWPGLSRRIAGVRNVGSLEATQLINRHNAVVLDVREDKEYAEGHISGSRHIPLGQLRGRIQELEKYKSRPVVVICRSGARSAGACGVLRKSGFEQVYNLSGGLNAWKEANMPVEKK